MKSRTTTIPNVAGFTVFVFALMMLTLGCGSDEGGNGTDTDPIDYSPNVSDDIATSTAAILAAENGGATAQILDIVALAGTYGLSHTHIVAGQLSATYDLDFKYWEWEFAREYSSANGLYQAQAERTYRWQFLNKSGQPQVTYVFNGDTAYTIDLTVVSGAGRHLSPFLSQTLDSLYGHLVATGTNTEDISISGEWFRSALDTIRTRYAVRLLQLSSNLTINDMQCRRDSSSEPWNSLYGAMSGTLSADIDFVSGESYPQDTVTREIGIALDSGTAAVTIGDSTWYYGLRRGDPQL